MMREHAERKTGLHLGIAKLLIFSGQGEMGRSTKEADEQLKRQEENQESV